MNIRELLLEEHSKKRAQYICDGIIEERAQVSELLELIYHGDIWMRQRSSWPLELLAIKKESLIHPHLHEIIEVLNSSNEDAILRNLYRSMQHMSFTEDTIGPMYQVAFGHLADPKSAIAIQAFAMSTCSSIAHIFPELAHELVSLIESYYATGSAGYKARANRELKRLNKLINQ